MLGAVILWFAPVGMGRYGTYVLSLWLVMSIGVMGLNLTLGYAGQTSLAQAAFMGLGAYATAILTTKYGVSWYAAFGLSGLLTFAVGILLGFPALRVQDALPRLRDARLLDADLARPAQRAMADRRRLRHLQHQPARLPRASSCSARWNSTVSSSS